MILVAESARKESERHLRAQVLVERVRAASRDLDAITWQALANTWSSGSQRLRLDPETVTRGYAAWYELDRSLKEARALDGDIETRTLQRDANALYDAGVSTLGTANRDLQAAKRSASRRFRPLLERLNRDAERAGRHQSEVARQSAASARAAFIGSMAFGLLALALIAVRFQRLRRRATLADELRVIERRSEERLRALLEHSNDVVTVVDSGLLVRWQAASVFRMLGRDPSAVVGRPLTTIVHPDDVSLLEHCLNGSMKRQGNSRVSVRFRHADGHWLHVETVAQSRLHDPAIEGVVLSMRDVTERKMLEDELRHQAFHDALTGLANRALFEDRLSHALARVRRNRLALAVVFLDLDDFKVINDSLGHVRGDELLQSVAIRIQETLRPADTAARLGGDEFAVLIEAATEEDAAELVADRIVEALAAPFEIAGRELRMTASVGIAHSDGTHRVEDLLRNADTAMYSAKEEGKRTVKTFEQSMHRRALDRLELTAELRRAVENKHFRLEYQPIVSLDDGDRIVGVEALVRWQHPERDLLAPDQFIELAEETGTIVPLGLWILETACARMREWQLALPPRDRLIGMSVNVSVRQLQEPDFSKAVAEVLRNTGLPPETLTLEITEGLLRDDHDAILCQLEQLKALGLRIAVDDFGTGYSSLSHLSHFPIDILKIDRTFVAGLNADPGNAELVRGIVNLGESLHLDVVVEGIERSEQADGLRAMGVRLAQGFFFSCPVPAEEARELLERQAERSGASA